MKRTTTKDERRNGIKVQCPFCGSCAVQVGLETFDDQNYFTCLSCNRVFLSEDKDMLYFFKSPRRSDGNGKFYPEKGEGHLR
jgi:transposase-like protein